MKPLSIGFWLALAFVCGTALANNEIRWAPNLAAARNASTQYKVPLLIHFYGDNCLPCTMLEQRVFTKPELVETLNKFFICVRINGSKNPQTTAEFQVHSWPTDVFVSPDGKTLYQGVCPQDLSGYLSILQNVAVMNRDRNLMLAAAQPQAPTQSQVFAQQHNVPAQVAASQMSTHNPQLSQPYQSTANAVNQSLAQPNQPPDVPRAPILGEPTGGAFQPAGQPRQTTATLGNSNAAVFNNTGSLPPHNASQDRMQQMPMVGRGGNQALVAPEFLVASSQQFGAQATAAQLISNPYAVDPTTVVPKTGILSPADVALPVPSAPLAAAPPSTVDAQQVTFHPRVNNPTAPTSSPADQASTPQDQVKPALEGYCPVALTTSSAWVIGSPTRAVKHRGKVYWLSSDDAVSQFLQAPDRSSPLLSGYDPYVFLNEGKLVEGDIRYGLHEQISGNYLLFSSATAKQAYWDNFNRYSQALDAVLKKAGAN